MSKLTLPTLPSEKTVVDVERRVMEIAAEIDAHRVKAGLPPKVVKAVKAAKEKR